MGSVKVMMFAAAAAFASISAAVAADLPPVMHRPPPPPVCCEDFGAWYLRGDLGFSNQRVDSLFSTIFNDTTVILDKGFDAAPLFGVGVGFQYNWFRVDVTGEYRGGANFRGMDRYTDAFTPTGFGANDYYARKSEWLFLANAYVDLGTWWRVTPFVGAGVGGSYNTISGFRDVNVVTSALAYAEPASMWNFAWAVHAGLAYKVSNNFTVELAYRYVSLGDALTGDAIGYNGQNLLNNPMHFRGITSHDVKLGVRWLFDTAPAPLPPPSYGPPPPLMRKG